MGITPIGFKGFITKIAGFVTKKGVSKGIISSPSDIAKYTGVQPGSKCGAVVKTVQDTVSKYTGKECTKSVGLLGEQVIKFKDGRIFEYIKTDAALTSRLHYPNGVTKNVVTQISKNYREKIDAIKTMVQYEDGKGGFIGTNARLRFPSTGGFMTREKSAIISDPTQTEIYSCINDVKLQ